MRAPQQKRSAESLERVIRSAEHLLRRSHAEDLTVAQVVADSGVSVGAIYARFGGKEGVFAELVSRFMRTTLAAFQRQDLDHWRQQALPDALAELVMETGAIYREHRGVLRALTLRTRLARADNIKQALAQYNAQVHGQLCDLLLMHERSIDHPKVTEAVQTSVDVMTAMLRDAIVTADEPTSDSRVESRVVDLLLRFLMRDTS